MKLLVLSPVVPDAPSDGDRLRLYHWLELLSRRHEIQLACFADPARPSDWSPGALEPGLSGVLRVARPRRSRALAAGLRLASAAPASVAAEASARMLAAVDGLVGGPSRPAGRGFDAVLAYRLKMAPYALRFRGPRFLDYTDSMTRYAERLAAERALRGARLGAAWARVQARRLAAYEAWCADQFDAGFFNARQDRDAVAGMAPWSSAALRVAANGVDLDAFTPPKGRSGGADPWGLLFVGNLAYPPNADAVEWFVRRVLPRVRAAEPRAHLTVAGGGASRRLLSLAGAGGLRFTGFVPDTRPLLWDAAVSVCPVRTGAGRQNKLLEAFAAGLPAVATPLAAEGVEAGPGRDVLVASDPETFAGAVLRLLRDPSLGRSLARRARSLARASYDWAANAGTLERAMLAATRRPLW